VLSKDGLWRQIRAIGGREARVSHMMANTRRVGMGYQNCAKYANSD